MHGLVCILGKLIMIEILFSKEFDSGVWNGPKTNEWGSVGQVAVGELGLLDLLETQLGLKRPESISYQRKIDYLQALRSAQSSIHRFYTESLKTDPMAVTEHLLELRDTLVESGWKKNQVGKLAKIFDLVEVEKFFLNKTGKADRLVLVADVLSDCKKFEIISSITVYSKEDSLSFIWKTILKDILPKFGVKVTFFNSDFKAQADPKTDLGKLVTLRKSDSKPVADGSFTLLTGRDPWESARYVAAYLKTLHQEDLAKTVILAPDKQRGILMSAMISQGIAYGGNHAEVSYARPALQILILALALTWEPKDPSVALSLLTMEGSPVHGGFRRKLIASFDQSLAVGGSTWSKYLAEITDELIEKAKTDEEKEKIKNRKERITEWFSAPSYSFEHGIPLDDFVAVCGRVSKWLRQIWALKKQSSFREAYDLSELLSNLAKGLGEPTISRERMIHLLIDSVGDGIIADGTIAQSGGVRIVGHSSSIIDSCDYLIWWDFSSSTVNGYHEIFFSKSEVAELLNNKIAWPDPELKSISEAQSWNWPIMNTKKAALLVSQLLDSDGNANSFHPLLDELIPKQIRQKWKSEVHVNLLEKQSKVTKAFLKAIGATANKKTENYFVSRPEWISSKDQITLREVESASSLSKLLGCDLAYVLTYKAHLSGEDSASIEYNERIMGIIAHEVISLVFKKGVSITPKEAIAEANKLIDGIIKDKAPQILQKERARDLSDLKQVVLRDVDFYANFIQDNKLSIIEAEVKIEKSDKTLGLVHVNGQIDHILADANGKQVIVDHKFGGAKWKEKDLVEGKSLQLALYSKLISGKPHPDLAYHIINNNKILVLNKSFSRAQQVNGPDSAEVLLDAENKISEKAKILKSGKLTAHGLIDENENERFSAPCGYCEYKGICGLAWKQGE